MASSMPDVFLQYFLQNHRAFFTISYLGSTAIGGPIIGWIDRHIAEDLGDKKSTLRRTNEGQGKKLRNLLKTPTLRFSQHAKRNSPSGSLASSGNQLQNICKNIFQAPPIYAKRKNIFRHAGWPCQRPTIQALAPTASATKKETRYIDAKQSPLPPMAINNKAAINSLQVAYANMPPKKQF